MDNGGEFLLTELVDEWEKKALTYSHTSPTRITKMGLPRESFRTSSITLLASCMKQIFRLSCGMKSQGLSYVSRT